jgi:predicted nuclease of predicted toxin-antitoxin system
VLRLLADENFPGAAVNRLRERGHDVAWIRTDAPGISDDEVLGRARNENRILITFDKDFGERVFRAGQNASAGVVLFRLTAKSPWFVAELAAKALESRTDWAGNFAVIEEGRVRITKLP